MPTRSLIGLFIALFLTLSKARAEEPLPYDAAAKLVTGAVKAQKRQQPHLDAISVELIRVEEERWRLENLLEGRREDDPSSLYMDMPDEEKSTPRALAVANRGLRPFGEAIPMDLIKGLVLRKVRVYFNTPNAIQGWSTDFKLSMLKESYRSLSMDHARYADQKTWALEGDAKKFHYTAAIDYLKEFLDRSGRKTGYTQPTTVLMRSSEDSVQYAIRDIAGLFVCLKRYDDAREIISEWHNLKSCKMPECEATSRVPADRKDFTRETSLAPVYSLYAGQNAPGILSVGYDDGKTTKIMDYIDRLEQKMPAVQIDKCEGLFDFYHSLEPEKQLEEILKR